ARPAAPAGVERPPAFSHPPAFTESVGADEGGVRDLPPTADPDDPVDEVDDYLLDEQVGDSELDLEAVVGGGDDPDLDEELDEILDLVSDGEIEAVALSGSEAEPDPSTELERMGLPPVSAAAEGELDSADPDTIVAADEPPPAVEPSVDDLQLIESETTAPGTPDDVGVREPSDGDLPEWLAGEQGTEDRGETTGGEVDLSMSLESIPESARLSQLDGTAEEDDDLSGDLELELALEVDDDLGTGEAPTPARGVRRPTDQVPTLQDHGTGGGPPADPDES
ncbi:MAG: hypothetical protein QGH45_07980, partial [Myxococcota bacterium]|nr:hypothetical protein [Myxococcota bacterium]